MTNLTANSNCPICGVDTPHVHNLTEQGQYTKIQRLNAELSATQAREAYIRSEIADFNADRTRAEDVVKNIECALSNSAKYTERWLAEHDAKVLENAAYWFNDHVNQAVDTWQAIELRRMANELRSGK